MRKRQKNKKMTQNDSKMTNQMTAPNRNHRKMQNHMTKNDKKYIQQPSDFAGKIFINFIEYTAYKLHVNCTETTDVI
jgi:hypothetical protein